MLGQPAAISKAGLAVEWELRASPVSQPSGEELTTQGAGAQGHSANPQPPMPDTKGSSDYTSTPHTSTLMLLLPRITEKWGQSVPANERSSDFPHAKPKTKGTQTNTTRPRQGHRKYCFVKPVQWTPCSLFCVKRERTWTEWRECVSQITLIKLFYKCYQSWCELGRHRYMLLLSKVCVNLRVIFWTF